MSKTLDNRKYSLDVADQAHTNQPVESSSRSGVYTRYKGRSDHFNNNVVVVNGNKGLDKDEK